MMARRPAPPKPVRYVFEIARADDLRAGQLTTTLRSLGRRRHAQVGQEIILGVDGRNIATARVSARARLIIHPRGLLRVLDARHNRAGERLIRLARAAEQGSPQAEAHQLGLAQALGFDDWTSLYAWHAAHGLTAGERLWRELVGWDASTLSPNPRDPDQ